MSEKFNTPEEAELAFYDAIERSDISALGQVWSMDDSVVCIHPGAARIEGRSQVLESFSSMFSESPTIAFSLSDSLQTETDSMAIHLVREEIEINGQLVSIMVSTNIYHLEDGGWRMLLHHSSHEPEFDGDENFDDFEDFDDDIQELPVVLH